VNVSVVAQSNRVVVCLVSTVERVDGLFSEDKHTYIKLHVTFACRLVNTTLLLNEWM